MMKSNTVFENVIIKLIWGYNGTGIFLVIENQRVSKFL